MQAQEDGVPNVIRASVAAVFCVGLEMIQEQGIDSAGMFHFFGFVVSALLGAGLALAGAIFLERWKDLGKQDDGIKSEIAMLKAIHRTVATSRRAESAELLTREALTGPRLSVLPEELVYRIAEAHAEGARLAVMEKTLANHPSTYQEARFRREDVPAFLMRLHEAIKGLEAWAKARPSRKLRFLDPFLWRFNRFRSRFRRRPA